MAEKRREQVPPIRIKAGNKATAERIAAAIGVPYIQVVEWAVEALGEYFDAHKGRLLLPLDFRDRFTVHREGPMILHEPPRARSTPTRTAVRK